MEIQNDPRVRAVPWRDLVRFRWWQSMKDVLLPLPWLALSWVFFAGGNFWLALPCAFFFYLAGLRVVHDAFHGNLGLRGAGNDWVQFGLSVLMLGSMHAVRHNHLHHHRHCMEPDDIEGNSARLSAWKVLIEGPLFPVRNHRNALRHAAPAQRRWIQAELAANVLWIAAVFLVFDVALLRYHVIAMAVGQCFSAFFCVWTVHHDCDDHHFIARTDRGAVRNLVFMNMFFHVEHHLFPRVPTSRLGKLAERLDRAAPELQTQRVF